MYIDFYQKMYSKYFNHKLIQKVGTIFFNELAIRSSIVLHNSIILKIIMT